MCMAGSRRNGGGQQGTDAEPPNPDGTVVSRREPTQTGFDIILPKTPRRITEVAAAVTASMQVHQQDIPT